MIQPSETASSENSRPITGSATVIEDVRYGTKNEAIVAIARIYP